MVGRMGRGQATQAKFRDFAFCLSREIIEGF